MSERKILLVDDNRDFTEMLSIVLEEEGYIVDMASNSDEALRLISAKKFDAVFFDVRMPGMNGVECFLAAKKIEPDIKYFLMTGYSADTLLERAMERGICEILFKPVDTKRLLDLLSMLHQCHIVLSGNDEKLITRINRLINSTGRQISVLSSVDDLTSHLREHTVDLLIIVSSPLDVSLLPLYKEMDDVASNIPSILVTKKAGKIATLSDFSQFDNMRILESPFRDEDLFLLMEELGDNNY